MLVHSQAEATAKTGKQDPKRGITCWPEPQRGEADLATQIRQALGAGRFDQVYAAGARLSRRDAVAAARDQRTATRAS